MMTDREMLELAAKAAGIEHLSGEYCVSGPELWDIERKRWWRPLTNDGDALRLAASLDIEVVYTSDTVWAECKFGRYGVEWFGDYKLTATRRAIVRAAAQIGAQM